MSTEGDEHTDGGMAQRKAAATQIGESGLYQRWLAVRDSERAIVAVTAIAILLFPYLFAGAPIISDVLKGYYNLTTLILIWGIFAMAYDLLHGFTGLLSFGHAAFWGMSGMVAGWLVEFAGIGYPLVLIAVGLVVGVLLAWLIGFLSLRRGGIYFAILTLAFGQMFYFTMFGPLGSVTGGEDGLLFSVDGILGVIPLSAGVPIFTPLGLIHSWLYLLVGIFTIVSVAVAYRVLNSPYGLVFKAIRENEQRTEFVGLNVWRYKLLAFIISGAFSGLAGALFVVYNGTASASSFYWTVSGEVVIMSILGGVGTLFGGFLGAAVYLYMANVLSTSIGALWHLLLGAIFVLVVWLFPHGLWGGVDRFRAWIVNAVRTVRWFVALARNDPQAARAHLADVGKRLGDRLRRLPGRLAGYVTGGAR